MPITFFVHTNHVSWGSNSSILLRLLYDLISLLYTCYLLLIAKIIYNSSKTTVRVEWLSINMEAALGK